MKKDKLDLNKYIVATFDIETDPFKAGRKPEPFSFGFYKGAQTIEGFTYNTSEADLEFFENWETLTKEEKQANVNKYRSAKRRQQKTRVKNDNNIPETYIDFWDNDPEVVKAEFINHLESLEEPHLIFAHNGGKFDYMYFHAWIRGKVFVINGRLVEWEYITQKGIKHILRDSYAILPVALGTGGDKLDIDYRKMEKSQRNKYKDEILKYLKQDCIALYDLCLAFKHKYDKWFLTLASASYSRIKAKYQIENTYLEFDETYRKFYFGGRCQAFNSGEIKGDIEVYDVNSMYPYAMSEYNHPMSKNCYVDTIISDETFFVVWKGKNFGAVPSRLKTGEINFDIDSGVFYTSIHEFLVCKKYSLIEVDEIIETHNWVKYGTFKDHIDDCKTAKETAEKGSKQYILAKLDMNSGYGKFAQDPRKYKDYEFVDPDEDITDINCDTIEGENFKLLCSPVEGEKRFNNVAIAASITGASRAMMLEGLIEFTKAGAKVFYCDTDSIICDKPKVEVNNLKFHESELGAWDKEKTGDTVYIGGKKIYALFKNNNCVKIASKGVRVIPRDIYNFLPEFPDENDVKIAKQDMMNIGGEEIKTVAMGGEFLFKNDAPSLKLDGNHNFVERNMTSTFTQPTLLELYKNVE